MSTLEITLQENASANQAERRPRNVPLFIPRDQLYYWTRAWQEGESEALMDLEEGRFRTFPDGASAAEWLLGDSPAEEG